MFCPQKSFTNIRHCTIQCITPLLYSVQKQKAREMFADALLELEFQESEDAKRRAEEKAERDQEELYTVCTGLISVM